MDLILKHPTIKSFLIGFNRQDYTSTIRQLVLIGIETVLLKFKGTSNTQLRATIADWTKQHKSTQPTKSEGTIVRQIQEIKEQLSRINQKFELVGEYERQNGRPEQQTKKPYYQTKSPLIVTIEPEPTHYTSQADLQRNDSRERRRQQVTPKVTEVFPQPERHAVTKKLDKRLLDDSQSRLAMTYFTEENKQSLETRKNTIPPTKKGSTQIKTENPPQMDHTEKLPTYETVVSGGRISKSREEAAPLRKPISKSPPNPYKKKQPNVNVNNSNSNSQQPSSVKPKYLKKVQSKIKDLVEQDKFKSKMSVSSKKRQSYGGAQQQANDSRKQNNEQFNSRPAKQHESDGEQDLSFSPYKTESNIAIANKFLSSQIAQQFSESALSESDDIDSKNSEFSIFRPNFTENGSGVTDSAASFSQSRQRQKQIGRISRRHE